MIWLRRILAIPLIFLFVLTFVLGLVLCHVSGTVGSAGSTTVRCARPMSMIGCTTI